jgi:hypothetical protein
LNDEYSPSKGEKYYDDHIAPKLRELAEECKANGLSLLAICEWEPGEFGRILRLQPESGFGIRMADTAAKANGNVDTFLIAVMRHAREHGHGSVFLERLGVPASPVKKSQEDAA